MDTGTQGHSDTGTFNIDKCKVKQVSFAAKTSLVMLEIRFSIRISSIATEIAHVQCTLYNVYTMYSYCVHRYVLH